MPVARAGFGRKGKLIRKLNGTLGVGAIVLASGNDGGCAMQESGEKDVSAPERGAPPQGDPPPFYPEYVMIALVVLITLASALWRILG